MQFGVFIVVLVCVGDGSGGERSGNVSRPYGAVLVIRMRTVFSLFRGGNAIGWRGVKLEHRSCTSIARTEFFGSTLLNKTSHDQKHT